MHSPAGLGPCQGMAGTREGHRQSSQVLSTGRGCVMSQRGLCHSGTSGAVSWSQRAAVMSERGCVTAQSGVCEVTDGAVTSQSLLCEVIERLWHHREDYVTSQSRL